MKRQANGHTPCIHKRSPAGQEVGDKKCCKVMWIPKEIQLLSISAPAWVVNFDFDSSKTRLKKNVLNSSSSEMKSYKLTFIALL